MSDDARNDGLHPRHPGRGKGTHLIEAEGDSAEEGGFFIFFNSGATKVVRWREVNQITPTLEASKKYAAALIEALQKSGQVDDIDSTNWASVTAAIQRIILDWNGKLARRVGAEMAKQFGGDVTRLMH